MGLLPQHSRRPSLASLIFMDMGMSSVKGNYTSPPSSYGCTLAALEDIIIPFFPSFSYASGLVLGILFLIALLAITRKRPSSTSSKTRTTLPTHHPDIKPRETCPITHLLSQESVALPNNLSTLPPYTARTLRSKLDSKSKDLSKLDRGNLFTINFATYTHEHALRSRMIRTRRNEVIQILPSALPACHALLARIVDFLPRRYPRHFSTTGTPGTASYTFHNHLTSSSYSLHKVLNPLEIAALNTQEDLNIIAEDEGGEWRLVASATLFPAGWSLEERIGWRVADLHGQVPGWARLKCNVDGYFRRLVRDGRREMERHSLFVQTDGEYFKDEPIVSARNVEGVEREMDVHARTERQTFTRLQGCVLFTVHTSMDRVRDMRVEEVEALMEIARGWRDGMESYHRRDVWFDEVSRIRDEKVGELLEHSES